ncbi:MAG: 50S ribosomal protein L22 [Deltaproteobacteria bacterium]|jgi:large subunit ribosomal protein L22|nr:50S ribosomal protein L22 [Deltaproteobacteria bacterium]
MEIKAVGKFLRVPPDKARIMARTVIGAPVESAINSLSLSPNKTSYLILKVLKSAVANAAENFKIDEVDDLVVYRIFVDRGPMLKRFKPCAHGRAKPILKRLCHITVVVKNRE